MDVKFLETGLNNVFTIESSGKKRIVTKSLVHGTGGRTIVSGNNEYRIWDPYHSKLASLVLKGASIPLKQDSTVLYLGAANGTTVSHVSDIVSGGTVFAVEFSPGPMRDLIRISAQRMNVVPILSDASKPDSYKNMVPEVDLIYQDIAQREQAGILIRNARIFLKKNGYIILIIKSRSVDSTKSTKEVMNNEVEKLKNDFKICESIYLKPFYSDHVAVILKKFK